MSCVISALVPGRRITGRMGHCRLRIGAAAAAAARREEMIQDHGTRRAAGALLPRARTESLTTRALELSLTHCHKYCRQLAAPSLSHAPAGRLALDPCVGRPRRQAPGARTGASARCQCAWSFALQICMPKRVLFQSPSTYILFGFQQSFSTHTHSS